MANKYTKVKVYINKVIELYESWKTQTEIAIELGLTQKIIFQRLKDVGYKCRVAKKRNQLGSNNHMWKGDSASYKALHYRIYSAKGNPKKCDVCLTDDKEKSYDWANLSGRYFDINDYKRMCRSCHWKFDKKFLNFKGAKGGRPSTLTEGGDAQ